MSPDMDAGLPRGDDASRVAGLCGQRHSHHSAGSSFLDIESDDSPSSDASSHVFYPTAPYDAVGADPHRMTNPSNPDNCRRQHAAHSHAHSSLLPAGDAISTRLPDNHTLSRSSNRSASSPLDSRSTASNAPRAPTGKPSVKDLKKRFDQNGDSASASKPQVRPTNAPRMTRPTVKTANGDPFDSRTGISQAAHMQAALESSAATRQRAKLAAQPAVPGSEQSFASRIGKPRGSAMGKVPGSKSLTLTPQRSSHHPSSSSSTNSRSPGLLFGEIPAGQRGLGIAGFGIRGVRPRGASESGSNRTSHQRSYSGHDVEQPYPNSWSRRVEALQHQAQANHPRHRHRSRSDAAVSLSSVEIGASCRSPRRLLAPTSPESSSSSKLPISARNMSGSNGPTSPPFTRSNSPVTLKCSLAGVRVTGAITAAAPPAPRVAATATRGKTPAPVAAGRKQHPTALATPDSARLQAYIAAPSPKLSPPLRSSRPRVPISVATSSGLRVQDSSRSSHVEQAPGGPKADDAAARRRKISFGPIDFEQRREHIRLAYSKSIRESEALEERQIAAERRRRESSQTAKAIGSTKSPTLEATSTAPSTDVDTGSESAKRALPEHARSHSVTAGASITDAASASNRPVIPPLTIRTTLESAPPPGIDSPTLGVPGSFPALSPKASNDEQPHSALTANSETTEFDVEPQTNPPLQASSPLDVPITVLKPPSPAHSIPLRQAEYKSPFEDQAHFQDHSSQRSATAQEPMQAADCSTPSAPGAFGSELTESGSPAEAVATVAPSSGGNKVVGSRLTTPFPQLDMQDESDCHSDIRATRHEVFDPRHDDENGATDAYAEETDDGGRAEYRQSDFRLDELSSHRTSTCASSDTGALDDMHDMAHSRLQITNTSSLAVPKVQTDRLSQQSAWTDFSVDSVDTFDSARPSGQRRQASPYGHVTIFGSRSSTKEGTSAGATVGLGMHIPDDTKRTSTPIQTQLPELDIGGGFFVPSFSPGGPSASLSFLPSPDHDPPPVPNSASASVLDSRTSSVFYDPSQYGSTIVSSERALDDLASPLETPHSLDAAPTETVTQYFAGRTVADDDAQPLAVEEDSKERRRLAQRHNVIRELIDTEAVFVRDMNIIEEIYKGTAEACPKLDSKTVKLIFRNSDEIIQFHTYFLKGLKEAVAPVYVPAGGHASLKGEDSAVSDESQRSTRDPRDSKDRATSLGLVFQSNLEGMKLAHEGFLRNSDQAAKRLIQIQQDPTVQVWLNECNEVAKDLTAAWDLDSLLIKPMQRITKYPNLIITLLQHTPTDHPDREALLAAKDTLETAIVEINRTKKNFELVGQIVGRKRKESDVKAGFARAFGKRVDKLQASNNRPPEDPDYAKLHEKFGDDYLRLQVVLRDVEFYTRQVSAYVHEFLQYLSSVELVMRLQPGNYPELESKWVQFNISVRDLEKVALEEHVRKHVIEPFELVIKAYGNPSLAMKKRQKRRLDYERSEQLRRTGRTVDPKLRELVEQYEALNDTLIKELPMLSALTEKVGNICLGNFVNIQADWYGIWKDKMKTVLGSCAEMPDLDEVVSTFQRDYPYARDQLASIGMLNPASWSRLSQSVTSMDDSTIRSRGRGQSVNGDAAPTLPAPDFGGRRSGSFSMSPTSGATSLGGVAPSPHHYYYRDYYAGINAQQLATASSSRSPEIVGSSRSLAGTGAASTRPSTGRSLDSGGAQRQSSESATQLRRDSNTTYNSGYLPHEGRRYSNIFHSALPLPDGPDDSRRSSRASSRERNPTSDGYNILWLAASLFEFNISTTKHEAGYPYLTYQAGEIFDVIAEKGELWLAKNQDDAMDQVGWIWSKHFAKLADS